VDQPNVVLVNCDDLGDGDLGCYVSTRNATPVLDQMAAEGLRFDDFYMASPVCSPSRGALLTGCYPSRIGFGDFDGLPVLLPGQGVGLSPSEISIGRLLSSAGYRTQMIGKWHCGDQPAFLPANHGFDGCFGIPYSNDMGRQVGTRTRRRATRVPAAPSAARRVGRRGATRSGAADRALRRRSRAVLRDARDRPFFLYLAHLYVHVPIYVQERFAERSSNGRYGAAVEAIDWATGTLLDELSHLGLEERTLVVFTSDNGSLAGSGGGSNAPLRGTKGTTWEGGMRVPCIARWPGQIESGRVPGELATAMDLYPTLAALGRAELRDDRTIDGRDIGPIRFDEGATSPHEAFYFHWMNDLEAVRSGRWKLHLAKHGEPTRALYDVVADPAESTDLIRVRPDVVEELETHAERARRSLGDARLGVAGEDVRPVGRVADPAPLTRYDRNHPYAIAEYDLPDRRSQRRRRPTRRRAATGRSLRSTRMSSCSSNGAARSRS